MSIIVDPPREYDIDPFGSQIVALPISSINYKPTWGVSELRYKKTEIGTGASATETGGEFKLSPGTTTGNLAQIRTLKRGQYWSGAQARAGAGVRIPAAPGSTAVMRWGYFDDDNGFMFGRDATGVFVMRRSGGVDASPVYQSSWNFDKMDGTGKSGLTLDLAKGIICQIDFTWYAYGIIVFQFLIFDPKELTFKKYPAHVMKVDNSVSIIDPNQPITFSVENGASNTTNYDLYIGGHQFEHFAGNDNAPQREVAELISNFTMADNSSWQPIISVRSSATFGPSGRPNSVLSRVVGYLVAADAQVETRMTYGGVTSSMTYGAPTGWTSAEAAVETKVSLRDGVTRLAASTDGFPSNYGFVSSTNQANRPIKKDAQLILSGDKEAILWVRRIGTTGTPKILHANLAIEEEH